MFRHARPLHALCLSASGGPARFLSSYPSDLRPLRARSGRPRHIHVAPRGVAASSSEARATHPEGAAKFPVPATGHATSDSTPDLRRARRDED
mmetsp:Transcript_28530/g.86081  ORF Transcript_28530/g.86081 Transcript_28530/m.86081 type:complete len:93 (-) Transcript_28530:559-837(-)